MLALTGGVMLLGLACSWLVLFPEGRAVGRRARARMAGVGAVCASHRPVHRRGWALAVPLVLVPPMLMLGLHRLPADAPSAADPPRARDEHIARLLQGERLSPPPPLPPEAFTTREVERVRPQLRGADREWGRLDPDFQVRLLRVFEAMRALHGYELVLLEGYRSPERQAQLAALGPHVTNAGMYQSYHQYGLAADVAFVRDGRVVISERDPWAMRGYAAYGELAEAHGLTWGGRWRMRDYGHVELRRPGARQRAAGGNL